MKMPPLIDTAFFAPCDMNCMICYKHCYVKKPCAGCFPGDESKQIKNLEKSYNQRYSASLMKNSLFVKEHGLSNPERNPSPVR